VDGGDVVKHRRILDGGAGQGAGAGAGDGHVGRPGIERGSQTTGGGRGGGGCAGGQGFGSGARGNTSTTAGPVNGRSGVLSR
jgi:hypothetical protein